MKNILLIYDSDILHYAFVLTMKDGNLIKEINAFVRTTDEPFITDLLRRFDTKVIDYARFEEKLLQDVKRYLKREVMVSKTKYKQRRLNFTNALVKMLKDISETHDGEFERVRWNDIKRKHHN
jgi:hypothetical protein